MSAVCNIGDEIVNRQELKELLYSDSTDKAKSFLEHCNDTQELYVYAFNYNWDDGFEIPNIIMNNPACGLSTALQLFWSADGLSYLVDKSEDPDLPKWSRFISELYENILAGYYRADGIAFAAPITAVQRFKLRKSLDAQEYVFIENIAGIDLDIPL